MSFIKLDSSDSIISSEIITAPAWSGNSFTLNTFYTSSVQESSTGKFFLNVYQTGSTVSGSEIQFSVAYGHAYGSSSAPFNSNIIDMTPTRDIYGQFRTLIYGDENAAFNFGGNNGISRDIYVLSVNRSRYKEAFNLGTLSLKLTTPTGSITLTDNSNDLATTTYIGTNRVYNIVSGSAGKSYNSTSVQTDSGSYGLFFPDLGTIILNPRALSLPTGSKGINMIIDETPSTSYTANYSKNNTTLYQTISGSGAFSLKSEETITSRFFNIGVKFSDFNYTTNPSIIDDKGNILYQTLIDNPQTFPTTVGLYNDQSELLAVAKLSKPLVKDNTKTINIRVKLEF
jgi:hypothetical protein